MKLFIALAIVLAAGCASPAYRLEHRVLGVDTAWKYDESEAPLSGRACNYMLRLNHEQPTIYVDGRPYTVVMRCVRVG